MNHINQLIDGLKDDFNRVKTEPKYMLQARERANTAGKILKGYALQLAHSMQKGETADIPFLRAEKALPAAQPLKALPRKGA